MLRTRGITTRLFAVLAVPVVVLLVLAVTGSVLQLGSARRAAQVEQLASGAGRLSALVSDLQTERTLSQAALDKQPVKPRLRAARRATDAALAGLREVLVGSGLATLTPQSARAAAAADRAHATLAGLRSAVDARSLGRGAAGARYTAVIAADIDLPAALGDGLADRTLAGRLTTYSAARRLAELAAQERDLGLAAARAGSTPSVSLVADLRRLAADQSAAGSAYRRGASPDQVHGLDHALGQPRAQRTRLAAERAALAAGARPAFSATDWRALTTSRIAALSALSGPVAADVEATAADAARSARLRALAVLLGGLILALGVGAMGFVLARGTIRPLRRLTVAAGELSAQLPRLVEGGSTSTTESDAALPELPVTSDDEVGRLARALVEVREAAVRVAGEQAAVRDSLAEVFVHVARRNHVLLSRQLAFIDQLERSEEDPDALDNLFRLDHLATRMRRNAESLLVLAGAESGRRSRRPMPLSDVVRTAISEIERYERVDLGLQVDPPLLGHVALTVAHLLAELLENATQFSDPDTRVLVATEATAAGVRVVVTDHGLGMTAAEIDAANERLAHPPVRELVGTQRFGFAVVGRLAQRLDGAVTVRPGRSRGTVATVDLPVTLFAQGSVCVRADAAQTAPAGWHDGPAVAGGPAGPPATPAAGEPAPTAGIFGAFLGQRPEPAVPAPAVPSAAAVPSAPVVPVPFVVDGAALLDDESTQPFVPVLDTAAPLPWRHSHRPAAPADADTQPILVPGPVSFDEPPLADEPERQPEPRAPLAAAGVPALDILPARATRGLRRRATSKGTGTGTDAGRGKGPAPATSATVTPAAAARATGQALTGSVAFGGTPFGSTAVGGHPSGGSPVGGSAFADGSPEPVPSAASPFGSTPFGTPSFGDGSFGTGGSAEAPEARRTANGRPAAGAPTGEAPSSLFATAGAPSPFSSAGVPSGSTSAAPQAASGAALLGSAGATVDGAVRSSQNQAATPFGTVAPLCDVLPAADHALEPAPGSLFAPVASPVTVVPEIVSGPAVPMPAAAMPAAAMPAAAMPAAAMPAAGMQAAADDPAAASSGTASEPELPAGGHELGGHEAAAELPAPAAAVSAPASTALAAAQTLRERSAMASEALSELSALSSYRPAVQSTGPAPLARRRPQASSATVAAAPSHADAPLGARRGARNAADVRTMLSGFRAGVERGRTTSPNGPALAEPASGADAS